MKRRFSVGETFQAKLMIDASIVERFADFSGDRNPIHLDPEEAKSYGYPRQVAHGAILVSLLSKMIGTEVPGPGAVWMSQSVEWLAPILVGDEIEVVVTVENQSAGAGVLCLNIVATSQKGETVMRGTAKVKVAERLTRANASADSTTRVALVTGGSRGIGAVIARRLAASGMTVAVNCRDSPISAEQVVQEIRAAGGAAEAFGADVGDQSAIANMVREIVHSFGQLDVVVHGASPVIHPAKIDGLGYRDIEPYLRVYLCGGLGLVASASPGMADRKFGRFIFLGTSYLFGIPPAGLAAYVVAKHALWGLVKCMAAELGPLGITSNLLSPSITVTDLSAEVPVRVKEVEARKSPMRRLAMPQDTAELVAFLASDAAGYINGANLPVTGGPI